MTPEPRVVFTEYALMRMHQRDIDEDEVRAALEAPSSRHRRREDGRAEVTQRFGRRMLLVVYRRNAAGITVINAMWE
ncbi:MAG: DUF4258 domain-containing protein [Dehalococcoidia bacterium]|nr:MAG: DUF4258 domain-containing protein [Dehalococcoidia bacterium]